MIKRQVNSDDFQQIVERLTERMQSATKYLNEAVVSGNAVAEAEYRGQIRAYDMTLFSITLNSTIVEEKDQ